MKSTTAVLAILLTATSCAEAVWAQQQQGAFVEVPTSRNSTTFDLRSLQMIQPGKFTIIETVIDNPDVLRLRLKVLDSLRRYCKTRSDGEYPAPADLFTLGPADMPVQTIKVKSGKVKIGSRTYPTKSASWKLPYLRLAAIFHGHESQPLPYAEFYPCKNAFESEAQTYSEMRNAILNGIRSKMLFDCKRGLSGDFLHEDDDISTAIIGPIPKGTILFEQYLSVCRAVTHEQPYMPR